jgi:hypothetical protein
VQQPAEPISTSYATGSGRWTRLGWIWRPQGQRPVRTLAVVVLDEGARDPLEVARDDDESHDDDVVHLYLVESVSFHVATPEAAVPLAP